MRALGSAAQRVSAGARPGGEPTPLRPGHIPPGLVPSTRNNTGLPNAGAGAEIQASWPRPRSPPPPPT